MIHLKGFNENINILEIEEDTRSMLSYLFDKYNIKLYIDDKVDYIRVTLSNDKLINWGDFREDIIQYFEYVNGKYTISKIRRAYGFNDTIYIDIRFRGLDESEYVNIDNIEMVRNDFNFWEISFRLEK